MIANSEKIQELLSLGLALVPSDIWNKEGKTKVPWWDYKKITKPLNAMQLADLMYDCKTESVAVLAGEISDNLFLIDVDTKHKKGFDAILFKDLKEIFPELLEKIRVERTQSGGYHLAYRINLVDAEGNIHSFQVKNGDIARREKTEEEISASKNKDKWVGFIEIKNICQCYPSPGYTLIKDGIDFLTDKLNVLSWEEHCSIFQLLVTYDEKVEEKYVYIKPTSDFSDYYDENPFEDFNNSPKAESVLEDHAGWKFKHIRGGKKFYIKPDMPEGYKDDGAIYNISKGFYKIFTTTTDLDAKAYRPVNLLKKIKFGEGKDANKQMAAWLISQGYGRIKPSREEWIIKKAVSSGKTIEELPQNISAKAKESFEVEVEKAKEKYPYGIFWQIDEETNSININRELLYEVSGNLGFRINNVDICLIGKGELSYTIEVVDERKYFDTLKDYMKDADIDLKNCYESFLQKSGKFTISRLPVLDTSLLLLSNKYLSYKFYKNGYLYIPKDGDVEFLSYSGMSKLVWKSQIQNRDYKEITEEEAKNGLYYQFLDLAVSGGALGIDLLKVIGYYSHDYKSTTTPYVAVLCESCDDAKKGGGSGKNIFTNLFKFTTTLLNKPAKGAKFDDTLLRTWKGHKILSLNDADRKFDYLSLRELSSGEGEVGKKFIQEITISNRDMPKFMVNTNFSFDPSLPGLRRRLIPIEFTEFFTKAGGVDLYFKVDFPSDNESEHGWSELDWNCFDWFIIRSIKEFLKGECKLQPPILSDGGWKKQFEQRFYKPTLSFINENIKYWLEVQSVDIAKVFNIQKDSFYDENAITKEWRLSSTKMNEALDEYCSHNGILFDPCLNIGRDPVTLKQSNVKVFRKKDDFVVIKSESSNLENYSKEDLPF